MFCPFPQLDVGASNMRPQAWFLSSQASKNTSTPHFSPPGIKTAHAHSFALFLSCFCSSFAWFLFSFSLWLCLALFSSLALFLLLLSLQLLLLTASNLVFFSCSLPLLSSSSSCFPFSTSSYWLHPTLLSSLAFFLSFALPSLAFPSAPPIDCISCFLPLIWSSFS